MSQKKINIELVSLDEIYNRADFISVHVPINDETKNLLNDETFAKCKNGVQ